MQWTMNENSLFAILLRSSFVWSFLIAGCMTAVMLAVIPEAYRAVAFVSGLPFLVIGCLAAWRQLRAPSGARISRVIHSTMPLDTSAKRVSPVTRQRSA